MKIKKGLWKFLLGLLKIFFRIGSKHLERKLNGNHNENGNGNGEA